VVLGRLPARTRSCIAGPAQRRTGQVDSAHGHVAEWLRNGLQNRVLRVNSGRGLQLSQSTKKHRRPPVAARLTYSDRHTGPWTRTVAQRQPSILRAGAKTTRFPEGGRVLAI